MADQQSHSQSRQQYLSPNQQDLLLAALTSQAGGRKSTYPPATAPDAPSHSPAMPANNDSQLYISPQQATFDTFDDYSPDLDYLDGDNFDFENADLGGEMIGALPGAGSVDDYGGSGDLHEKRKNSDDDDGVEEGDSKRQETQEGEKSAKKPGRKPLTSEPTTKRKAQNRAAQRAFRERKEKHLKDLETKVTELTKTQEADKHENGLLKAQVERLQVELREYRKRLSLNGGSGGNRSPTISAYGNGRSNSNPAMYGNNGFQFDFPKFGALPGSQMFGNQSFSNTNNPTPVVPQRNSATPPFTQSPTNGSFNAASQSPQYGSRQNSVARSMSQGSTGGPMSESPAPMTNVNDSSAFATYSTMNNMHGFASTLPQMNSPTTDDPFNDLFSPSILKSASIDSGMNYFTGSNATTMPADASATATTTNARSIADFNNSNGGDTTAGLNRVFQFNSTSSASDTASPSASASSASQWNGNANGSSCGTSPEPSHGSPANKAGDKFFSTNPTPATTTQQQQRHQSPLATSQSAAFDNTTTTNNDTSAPFSGLSVTDPNLPSLHTFDPVLFGDYRDPSADTTFIGDGANDFTGGFFDEALQPFDMSSPSNLFGILQSPTLQNQSLQLSRVPSATPSRNLMAEVEKVREGEDGDGVEEKKKGAGGEFEASVAAVAAGEKPKAMGKFGGANGKEGGKYISCNNIWNQLQSNPDFQDGKFDLDSLCAELKAKARCSESGVMVDQEHVDAALRKLGTKDEASGKVHEAPKTLLFERESWDEVLRKLNEH